jgi:hypothetical protein
VSVWSDIQNRVYTEWGALWAAATRYSLPGEPFDPEDQEHVLLETQNRPTAQETLGSPGNRKMSRRGVLYARVRVPPLTGDERLSDLAEKARRLFEARRLAGAGDIRFNACDIGPAGEIDGGRWRGVTVECPFDYEELI